MEVETLGDATNHTVGESRRTVAAAWSMTALMRCFYQEELDLQTLIWWTRGRNFARARLESRLMCPRRGCRRVIAFRPPAEPQRAKAAKREEGWPMKKAEAQDAMPHLIEKWAEETNEPWPPDGRHHYSFGTFWTWLQNRHHPYTQFRAVPDARYVAEMWFDKATRQTWRN